MHSSNGFIGSYGRWGLPVLLAMLFGLIDLACPGAWASDMEEASTRSTPETATHFETHIAPLLARHCLECHDSASQAGELDLSRKAKAFEGGETGAAIVPGASAESLVWQYVDSNEMPQDRAPLSDAEKALLKEWIDAGANYAKDVIHSEEYRVSAHQSKWVQRLTVEQYIETVRSALGVNIRDEALRLLPPDQRADGFTNTAYNLNVDLAHVQAYARLAETIVRRMDVPRFARQHGECHDLSQGCMKQWIASVGKKLYRGPLRDEEIASLLRISDAVKEADGDFAEAAALLLQAMLQSPRFLFRIENESTSDTPQLVGDFELASRLSYIIWGGPPDDRLLSLAEGGKLNSEQQIETEIDRMLSDPRAVDQSLRFLSEWFNLQRLESLQPNPQRYPQWNDELADDMRLETEWFFKDLVWKQKRPLWELMNAQFTYATPRLAHHYGLLQQESKKETAEELRISRGLVALYKFSDRHGRTLRDGSSQGSGPDLVILDRSAFRLGSLGGDLRKATLLASERPASKLVQSLKKSNAITLEAWITPATLTQAGPARILTLSNGISARNFTLGQDGNQFVVRLRTSKTSGNGLPALPSKPGSVSLARTHVVYTRDNSGNATIFVNGEVVGQESIPGDFSNWDERFHLAIGNELSKDRPWKGTLHSIAIYERALSQQEVRQNHVAGLGSEANGFVQETIAAAWRDADKSELLGLYRFDGINGNVIRDEGRGGNDLYLSDARKDSVVHTKEGLSVVAPSLLRTSDPPRELVAAIKKRKAFSVEAWITPANLSQDGPARILTLSSGTGERNFTLGQDGDRYDFRIRAGNTDRNGMPSLVSGGGSVTTDLSHIVFTANSKGKAKLYVDGELQASKDIGGSFASWAENFHLAIANETSEDRPWLGTYHMLAIYARELSSEEIKSRLNKVRRYDLAENPARGGLLTQGSILTIGGDHASMVARGLFILHDVLDSRVGNPPPDVDTTPIPTKPGMTMRGQAEVRLADASCAGCHSKFEPLAFGLEKFNGIGGFHEIDEHGNELRDDGMILFPGEKSAVDYQNSAELMNLLAASERVRLVITRKFLQYALGRPLDAVDLRHADEIHAEAIRNGGTYHALTKAVLTSDLIRMTANKRLHQ